MSSQYLYFTAILLYMFRVLPTLIIRSTKYCSTQPLVWTISYVGVVKVKNRQKVSVGQVATGPVIILVLTSYSSFVTMFL
jgi:hypothetical protein